MAKALPPCPICHKQASIVLAPFCSSRCSNVDLGRWLGEGYAVPAVDDPDEDASLPNTDEDEER